MTNEPEPAYRVVERDGRLVVEKHAKILPSKHWLLPRLPSVRIDPIATGLSLLAQFHYHETTPDGHILLTASQLHDYVQLPARPEDVYYLTPRQAALIGYKAFCTNPPIIFLGIVIFIILSVVTDLLWLLFLLSIITAGLGIYFKKDFEAISVQQYVPEEWGDPNAPAT